MAWRVKYRKCDDGGKALRIKFQIGSLGVHPKNRGGVYPSGKRCRNLCTEVVGAHGFLKENIVDAVVGVEEVPVDVASSRGEKFLSGSEYNIKRCKQDELLMGCFAVPHNNVQCKMLSHNHMILVLRAFLTKARWKIPKNEEKKPCVLRCAGQTFTFRSRGARKWDSVAGHGNRRNRGRGTVSCNGS